MRIGTNRVNQILYLIHTVRADMRFKFIFFFKLYLEIYEKKLSFVHLTIFSLQNE